MSGPRTRPGCAIAFALPFVAAGVFMIAMGLGHTRAKGNAPGGVLAAMGVCFAAAGVMVIVQGFQVHRTETLRAEGKNRDPGRPWLWDHAWDPTGTDDDGVEVTAGSLVWGAFIALFMVPFNWWAFFSKEGNIFVGAITGLFDAISLALLAHGLYRLSVGLKYGRSRLRFESFPFYMGETARVALLAAERLEGARSLKAKLSCLKGRIIRDDESERVVMEPIYEEEKGLGGARAAPIGGQIPLSFDIPADQGLPTALSEPVPVQWRLDLTADTEGLDFRAGFRLPVYRR
ncbi:MAG: hypothetical protein HY927_14425 [Elusimicrobia bacterium]|nr:hypothetical protein [Elusimicrobiota bacterium]